MGKPLVACVILNNKRVDDTAACLDSLYQNTYPNLLPIVLDNQSGAEAVATLCERFPGIVMIELAENLGYAGNNNIGIREALRRGADWVFVLNEDTVLDPDCVARLVEAGEANPRVGMVGPMVYHFDEPRVIQSGGGMYGPNWESIHLEKNEPDDGRERAPHPVAWLTGCSILARRALIESAGMLDEDFFCYWEENEWCMRSAKAGWEILHVPAAKLWHKGVQRSYNPRPFFYYYATRNKLLLMRKQRAPLRVWAGASAAMLRNLLSWTLRPKWRGLRASRDAMWRGMLDFARGRWGKQEV